MALTDKHPIPRHAIDELALGDLTSQGEVLTTAINARIRADWALKDSVTFSLSATRGYSSRVVDFVMTAFRRSGWTVKYHSDQRDGDYIEFS